MPECKRCQQVCEDTQCPECRLTQTLRHVSKGNQDIPMILQMAMGYGWTKEQLLRKPMQGLIPELLRDYRSPVSCEGINWQRLVNNWDLPVGKAQPCSRFSLLS